MEWIGILLLCVILILLIFLLVKTGGKGNNGEMKHLEDKIQGMNQENRREITESIQTSIKNMGEMIAAGQKETGEQQAKLVNAQLAQMENRLKTLETTNEQKLSNIRETMEKRLGLIQEDNAKKLEDMRKTVDEKLQKTLEEKMNQSFQLVSERLEQVYKGLGEMQTLASGVGDLKKILGNVKSRGIIGEVQLGAILEEILSPEQYDTNVATVPGSSNVVEYAVKLPAKTDGFLYLPIDSKFPGDTYGNLQDAYERGVVEEINAAVAALSTRIRQEAKDIHDKYIEPPYTTDFGILFLPFEGLYAEVVNRGLVEVLQREYHVNIAGPSTMAALLNSLQMGFRTLAIEKRSGEVWQVLGAVKTEFDKFATILSAAQNRLEQANKELDKLVGVRTRAIIRKLRSVEKIAPESAENLLDTEEITEFEDAGEEAHDE